MNSNRDAHTRRDEKQIANQELGKLGNKSQARENKGTKLHATDNKNQKTFSSHTTRRKCSKPASSPLCRRAPARVLCLSAENKEEVLSCSVSPRLAGRLCAVPLPRLWVSHKTYNVLQVLDRLVGVVAILRAAPLPRFCVSHETQNAPEVLALSSRPFEPCPCQGFVHLTEKSIGGL